MTSSRRIRPAGPMAWRLAVVTALCGLAAGCAGAGGSAAAPTSTAAPVRATAPPATTQTLNLPNVKTAELAACESDFQTLRSAEYDYQMVSGGQYASIDQLISGQYIQGPETYYVGVKVGVPVGGYTLLAAPNGPCASLPVRDPQTAP